MCEFSGNLNKNNLVLWWDFDYLTYNGSNYFVPDKSGNNRDGLVLSENRNMNNIYFSADLDSNETYINFTINYKKENSDSINLTNCYIKYNNQYSKIIFYNDSQPDLWSGHIVKLETPLIGMTNGERFSYICNQSNFYDVDGSIYFDGKDDFIFLENSQDFVENVLEYNNNFTIILDGNTFKPWGKMFLTRFNCLGEPLLEFGLNRYYIGYDPRIEYFSNYETNIDKRVVLRNSFYGNYSEISFFKNSNEKIINITNITDFNNYGNLIVLGKSLGCGNSELNGKISTFAIYNSSLSDPEIEKLFTWYSIRPLQNDINEIDVSSCNLEKNKIYTILIGTKNNIVEKTIFNK